MAVNTQSSPTLGRRGRLEDALTEWLAGRAAPAYPRIAIQLAQEAKAEGYDGADGNGVTPAR
ncbi:MAG TPA: hypothetical protein VFJ04_04325 [Rhodanobacteraceae bacterium]|nr:hypothetical protein [Rhodanobacteraceae bacterium]